MYATCADDLGVGVGGDGADSDGGERTGAAELERGIEFRAYLPRISAACFGCSFDRARKQISESCRRIGRCRRPRARAAWLTAWEGLD
jgi:hypothetical protein